MTLSALLLVAALELDPHSFGNADVVTPSHLALELTASFERRTLSGTAELTLDYLDAARASTLDLDSSGLLVERVTDPASGRELRFELGAPAPILGRRLRIHLPEPRPARVRIAYATSPDGADSALQWLEPRQTAAGRSPFLFSQNQAHHARSWIPCMDSPGLRLTYEATLRVPKGLTALMSAEALPPGPEPGVFRFRMPQSVPPYLVALAVGELEFRPLGPRTGVWAEPTVVARAAAEFEDAERMLQAAESLFGPYAWGRWDILVLPPSFPFGGMENPRLTFATPTLLAGDKSQVSVAAHELTHAWSGNLVTAATWSDFWLNEGFTSYLENRVIERLYGREVADMDVLLELRQWRREVERLMDLRPADTALYVPLSGRNPDETPGLVYPKGANLLHRLERHFGRERFDAFLRGYFAGHAFSSMSTARFLEILRRELFRGDDDAWRRIDVERWVYGRGVPDNAFVPVSPRFEATSAAAAAFAASGSADAVNASGWVASEWLDFLGALPRDLAAERLAALDARFHLSDTGNSEILSAWLRLAVRNTYEPAFPALERFLASQGRRKYVVPLFTALRDNPRTRERALPLYEKVRAGYHPVTAATLDALLGRRPTER